METKKKVNLFYSYDYMGAQEHLEKMAAAGWMFKSAGAFFWKYEKCEPKRVKFYCSYREGQEIEGWTFADTWGDTYIYYSADENVKPIYDREEDRIEDFRRVAGKSLKSEGLLLAVMCLFSYINVFSLISNDRVETLSSYVYILEAIGVLSIIIMLGLRIINMLVWQSRARKGICVRINTDRCRRIQVAYTIILLVISISALVFLVMESRGDGLGLLIGIILLMGIMIVLMVMLFKKLKARKVKALVWVLAILLSAAVTFGVLFIFSTSYVVYDRPGDEPSIPEYALSYEDITGNFPGQLRDVTYNEGNTIFLKKIYLEEWGEDCNITYYIAEVKNEKLYDWFMKSAISVDEYQLFDFVFGDEEPYPEWKEQKDNGWRVDKVYRLEDTEEEGFLYNEWVLAKDSRIIYLMLDFEPTDKQKAEIVKGLEASIENMGK